MACVGVECVRAMMRLSSSRTPSSASARHDGGGSRSSRRRSPSPSSSSSSSSSGEESEEEHAHAITTEYYNSDNVPLEGDRGRNEWAALLKRELAIANDAEHRHTVQLLETHGHPPNRVLYNKERAYFNPMNADSLNHNAELVCRCLDNIRRYYRVLPAKHCLPMAMRNHRNARIREYMTAWDREDERKELLRTRREARKRQARGL